MKHLNTRTLLALILVGYAMSALARGKESSEKEAEKPVVGSISAVNLAVKDYPATAKISSGQATKAATEAVAGKVLSVGLEKEDGYLVYAVEVVNPNSGLHEINVDAGNGKVLSKMKKGADLTERDEDGEEDDD